MTNPQPPDDERVPITDYVGPPTTPPLATPPSQRAIKQVEGRAATTSRRRDWPLGAKFDQRLPRFRAELVDGKLVLQKNSWRSRLITINSLIFLIWIFQSYGSMRNAVHNQQHTPEFPEIVTAIFTHPSFELVFYGLIFLASLALLAFSVQRIIRSGRGPGERLIFDLAADTLTDSEYPKAIPTPLSDIRKVNLDQRSSQYTLSLLLTSGRKVEIGKWYDEAQATQTASQIADYLDLPVTRSESPATVGQGCIVTIAFFIGLFLLAGLLVWLGGLIFAH